MWRCRDHSSDDTLQAQRGTLTPPPPPGRGKTLTCNREIIEHKNSRRGNTCKWALASWACGPYDENLISTPSAVCGLYYGAYLGANYRSVTQFWAAPPRPCWWMHLLFLCCTSSLWVWGLLSLRERDSSSWGSVTEYWLESRWGESRRRI